MNGAAAWRPIDPVSEQAPPALLVHGLEDRLIHSREAVNIQAKLRGVGVRAECRIHEDVGHMGTVLAMALPVRSKTLENVKGFIEAVVAGARLPEPGVVCPPLDGRKAPIGGPPRIPTRTARSG